MQSLKLKREQTAHAKQQADEQQKFILQRENLINEQNKRLEEK